MPGCHQSDLVAYVRCVSAAQRWCGGTPERALASSCAATADHASQPDMINIFEVFLPQLLRYPNPNDPLNGEAAALLMRHPQEYEAKVKGQCLGNVPASELASSSTILRVLIAFLGPLRPREALRDQGGGRRGRRSQDGTCRRGGRGDGRDERCRQLFRRC